MYVTNSGSNTISVIDGSTDKVVANIKVEDCLLTGVAVNPETNRVYVTNVHSIRDVVVYL